MNQNTKLSCQGISHHYPQSSKRRWVTPNLTPRLSPPLPLNPLISEFRAWNWKAMEHLVFMLPKLLHFTTQMQQCCSLWKGYANFEEITDLLIWPKKNLKSNTDNMIENESNRNSSLLYFPKLCWLWINPLTNRSGLWLRPLKQTQNLWTLKRQSSHLEDASLSPAVKFPNT